MSDRVIIAAVGQFSDGESVRTIGVSNARYHDPAQAPLIEGGTFLPLIDGDGGISWDEQVRFQPMGGTTSLQVSGLRLRNEEGIFDAWARYSVSGLSWTIKRGRPDQAWSEFELIFSAVGTGAPTFQGRSTMTLRLRDQFAKFGQPASQEVFDTDTPNERLVNQLVPKVYGDVLQVEGPLFDPNFFRIYLARNLAVIRRIHEGGTPTDNWIDVDFGAQVTRSVPEEAYPITADIGGPSLPDAELENLLEDIGGFGTWSGSPSTPDGWTVTQSPSDSEITEDVTNGGALIVSTLGTSTGGSDLNAGTAARGAQSTGRTLTAKDAADAAVTDLADWPALIDADDAARVIATVGGANLTSPRLTLTNFGAALGSSATLSGITVSIRAQKTGAGTGSIAFSEVRLQLPNGSVSVDKSASTAVTGTKTLHTFGGSDDAWGLTLTPDLVNSTGLGVRIAFTTGSTGSFPVAAEVFEVILTAHTSDGNQTLKLYVDVSAVTGDRYRPRITYDDLGASPADTITARWAFVDAVGDPVPVLTRTPGSTGDLSAESLNLSDPNVITEGVMDGSGVLEGELIADGPVFAVEFFSAPGQTGEQRLVRIDLDELSISVNRFKDLVRTLVTDAGLDPDLVVDNDSLDAIATATGDPVLGWYVRGNATFDQVATVFAHSLSSAVFPGLDGKIHAAMLCAPARPASGDFLEVIYGDRTMEPGQSEADEGADLRDRVNAAQNVDPLRPNETAGVTETWPESERQKVLSDWRITERVDWDAIDAGTDWPITAASDPTIVALESGSGNWTPPDGVTDVELLLAGPGAGGAGFNSFSNGAGGGGAGEVVYVESYAVTPGVPIAWSVPEGGLGGTTGAWDGQNPSGDTTFGTLTAKRGGGGQGYTGSATTPTGGGKDGASGGGCVGAGSGSYTGGASTASDGIGNAGGDVTGGGANRPASGGGGATQPGGSITANENPAGPGGDGYDASAAFGTDYGDAGWFGGGGGAGRNGGSGGPGGRGGGGDGASAGNGQDAQEGTGGGGGGGGGVPGSNGGKGARGIILIKYTPA